MPRLTKKSLRFLDQYARDFADLKRATDLAETAVRSALSEVRFDFYLVTSRTKGLASLRGKLRLRGYLNPAEQLTDGIGVRVITYYRGDVDRVVEVIRSSFEVDEDESEDKRLVLGVKTFGYRSVHLIVKLKGSRAQISEYGLLTGRWFEIQVRSILDHAWGEIEHEVVYKAGVKYSDEILRRFAAVAGTLEILEGALADLADERNKLIERYRQIYATTAQDKERFDVARLLGFLEVVSPEGRSWRRAASLAQPFPTRIETSCVTALVLCGLGTASALRTLMKTRRFRSAVRSLAAAEGIAPAEVSHLALITIALVIENPRLITSDYPEISIAPAIARFLRKNLKNAS